MAMYSSRSSTLPSHVHSAGCWTASQLMTAPPVTDGSLAMT